MNQKLLVVILLFLVAAIIIGVIAVSKKSITKNEQYGGSSGPTPPVPYGDCSGMFPPSPVTIPPSAYSKLVTPYILSSADNPNTSVTMHDVSDNSFNFYSDKFVCNTPWKMRAYNNDSCAQYGIGEMAEGPAGNQFCVCEAKYKNGGKIPSNMLNSDNIVIGVGGVCTKDSQCCTNNCTSMDGQFSKMCSCPKGQRWDIDSEKCTTEFYPHDSNFSTMYDSTVETYPKIPSGTAITTGKLCGSNSECSLGEACTPDNFCASQLIPDNERDGNKFRLGANCTATNQCANNLECVGGRCKCPSALMYNNISRYCECPGGELIYSQGKCIAGDQVKRTVCPTNAGTFVSGISQCGLGERFNPSTNQCICTADLHSKKIGQGGKCISSQQCSSGACLDVAGVSVCIEPKESLWDLSKAVYL